ncbi:Core-2/I-branching beta-1,6-N-acetylglucosaminyltransferase family protein [Quillaja saponaria]|uniref:Core-2/I-branching beta-1,6-N-acetylglucosaminyltransferase family protein n=1 Tax=Quillaja saponaria TaxID=32244 RepID=A0AAD7M0I6_QUISA|nr:Core-2/I-branching beta-1,6-N-acetylglucosaminyltransferase family protein [Quillaja saponaria]
MTKKPSPIVGRHVIWFSWKLVITFSASLCVFALFRFHYQPADLSFSTPLTRIRYSHEEFHGRAKIAFLFLACRNLPLDFLWGSFFENADVANFSIYIHSAPGFVFDESTTRSHFFYGRQLSNSIQVLWGESSMIEAERLLLTAALEEPANQRFVLLSDSCVPLYNFSYIYNYVMASQRSFVDSFLDVKEGRYNPKMSPKIARKKWRKGSQWITLVRSHAEVIVDDEVFLSIFKRFCKRRPPVDASKGKLNIKLQKQHNCIPDEHYMPTLLVMHGLEGELERRTLTYTLWNQSATKMENKGWHPLTFTYGNAGPRNIKKIKDINHVYYAAESRAEWCRSNSTSVPCFLFARKFSLGAAMRLLSEGVVGRFDTAALLDAPP